MTMHKYTITFHGNHFVCGLNKLARCTYRQSSVIPSIKMELMSVEYALKSEDDAEGEGEHLKNAICISNCHKILAHP